jgi:hypothetical protein
MIRKNVKMSFMNNKTYCKTLRIDKEYSSIINF